MRLLELKVKGNIDRRARISPADKINVLKERVFRSLEEPLKGCCVG